LSGLTEAKINLISDTNLKENKSEILDDDDIVLKRNFQTYDDKFLFQLDAFYDSDILIKIFLKIQQ